MNTRRAFTLTELLVVISITVLMVAIAVPTFSALSRSAENSLAQTRFVAAVRAARDAALSSTGDADTAAFFSFEPGGRTTITACVKVGVLEDIKKQANADAPRTSAADVVWRDVFVPIATLPPTSLPGDWMVRGYAPVGAVGDDWYEAPAVAAGPRVDDARGNWLFPETGFYDTTKPGYSDSSASPDGYYRQSFIVRFQAGSGAMVSAPVDTVLVVFPRQSGEGRPGPAAPNRWVRLDTATDIERTVRRILTDPGAAGGGLGAVDPRVAPNNLSKRRSELLGDQSTDTVLCRPVTQLALYRESRLARALQYAPTTPTSVSLDESTRCLYSSANLFPSYIAVGGATQKQIAQGINQWVEGDTNFDNAHNLATNTRDAAEPGDRPEALIYLVDRVTGEPREVSIFPEENAQ